MHDRLLRIADNAPLGVWRIHPHTPDKSPHRTRRISRHTRSNEQSSCHERDTPLLSHLLGHHQSTCVRVGDSGRLAHGPLPFAERGSWRLRTDHPLSGLRPLRQGLQQCTLAPECRVNDDAGFIEKVQGRDPDRNIQHRLPLCHDDFGSCSCCR